MSSDVRSVALAVLDLVRRQELLATMALRQVQARWRLSPGDSAAANRLALGVLRQRRSLDHLLAREVSRKLPTHDERLMDLLRLAAWELLFADAVPVYATVDRFVELTRRTKGERLAGFVNALLRRLAGRPRPELEQELAALPPAIRLSLPDWLVAELAAAMGSSWEQEAELLNRPADICLRVNPALTSREGLLTELAEAGLHPELLPGTDLGMRLAPAESPYLTPAFALGWFWPQDVTSQWVVEELCRLAVPSLSEWCCGRGSKTLALVAAGQRLVAADLDRRKLGQLRERFAAAGLPAPPLVAADLLAPPLAPASCAALFLDAPCSGLGTLRRHPELRWRRQPEDLLTNSRRQLELASQAADLVQPQGLLIYCVCSFTAAETTGVVSQLLARRPDFRWADRQPPPGPLVKPSDLGGDSFYLAILERSAMA